MSTNGRTRDSHERPRLNDPSHPPNEPNDPSRPREQIHPRKRPRPRSMRRRIAMLLVIPLVSLIGLWAFAASITVGDALQKNRHSTLFRTISRPITTGFTMVQYERSAAAVVLGTRGRVGSAQLAAIEAKTDRAVAAFRASALSAEAKGSVSPAVWRRVQGLVGQFDRLGPLRARIHSGTIASLDAIRAYSEIFDSATLVMSNLSNANDLAIYQKSLAVMNVEWSRDHMQRENDLMTALQASGARMSVAEHTAFVDWAANRRRLLDSALANLSGTLGASVDELVRSRQFTTYERLETTIVDSLASADSRVTRVGWLTVAGPLSQSWQQVALAGNTLVDKETRPLGNRIMLRLAVAGGLGLLAVAASILLSILFVRTVSRELRSLQGAARRLAEERLPDIVARLRRGENVDVTAETATELAAGRTREITSVAEAFTTVQKTAMETAVGEAELRKGISRVFMNLAWRSQSLLHRQLKMLDAMERRATDPDELEDLFRLDHLTTRMRRHAEGLVILSGSPTVRGWDQPVPVEDLLRAALSEVEDYTRVDVVASSAVSLTGSAVGDVIHLLAELVENATVFSPPNTEVLLRADIVGKGLAIEVVDRGIGMAPEELAAVNYRLAHPPEFDLADSDRLGLFVVGRLAARHGIGVVLQPSAYGGITAVVLIPNERVIIGEQPAVGNGSGVPVPRRELTARTGQPLPPPPGPSPRTSSHPPPRTSPDPAPGARADRLPPAVREPFEPVRKAGSDRFTAPSFSAAPERERNGTIGRPVRPVDRPVRPVDEPVQPAEKPIGPVDEPVGPAQKPVRPVEPRTDDLDSEETGLLPRRIRQQNLAPQLRDRRTARPAPHPGDHFGDDDVDDDPDRPELSRNLMSSLQAGWTLGREAGEDTGDEDTGPGGTVLDHRRHTRREEGGHRDAAQRDE